MDNEAATQEQEQQTQEQPATENEHIIGIQDFDTDNSSSEIVPPSEEEEQSGEKEGSQQSDESSGENTGKNDDKNSDQNSGEEQGGEKKGDEQQDDQKSESESESESEIDPNKASDEEEEGEQKKELAPDELLDALSDVVEGDGFKSIEEIKEAAKAYKEKQESEQQFQGLTEEEIARINAGREFGDYKLYDELKSLDPQNLDNKEVLRQQFFLDEKNRGRDPEYLNKKFEKEYKAKYVPSEDEDEEDKKFYADEEKEAAKDARKELENKKQKLQELAQKNVKGEENEPDPKEEQKQDEEWYDMVDNTLKQHDSVEQTVENKEANFSVDISRNKKKEEMVQKAMDQPGQLVKELIGDKNDNVDPSNLHDFVVWNTHREEILTEVYKQGQNDMKEQFLKDRKNNDPQKANKGGEKQTEGKSLADGLADLR